jgi:cyclophilin family peptidyl-prolyl cis-trans isomerase
MLFQFKGMAPHHKEYHKPHKHKSSRNTNGWMILSIIAILVIVIGTFSYLPQTQNGSSSSSGSISNPTAAPTFIPANADPYAGSTKVLLHTSVGDITVELRNDMPITTGNFINLMRRGIYDGTTFYRVMAGFMIQGGANETANVATIKDEITTTNRNLPYTIAMAKTSAPDSASSQFFINVVDNGKNLVATATSSSTEFDNVYSAFGRVIAGQSVVDAIANAPTTILQGTGEKSQPINPVTLLSATILQ